MCIFQSSRSKKMFEVIQEVKNPLDFMEMYRLLSDVSDHDIIYPKKTSSSKDGSIVSNSSSMDRERLLLWKDRGFFSILMKRFLRVCCFTWLFVPFLTRSHVPSPLIVAPLGIHGFFPASLFYISSVSINSSV